MEQEFRKLKAEKLRQSITNPDNKNIGVMKSISKVDPKYAKHMFLRNELLENFAMQVGGGIDLLSQPVCTHCEKPAAWDDKGSAYCFSCNKTIPAKDVITVIDYLMEYTKMFTEEQLEVLTMLGGSKDEIIR